MKISKFSLFLLFILLSLLLVSWEFQRQEGEDTLSNVSSNTSSQSFKPLENKTPLEGEFQPVLTYPEWDFQGYGDRIFVYYDGAVKAYGLETGELLMNITPVYNYYFSNRYAYLKTNNGSFILDYKTLKLERVTPTKEDKYVFKFGDCVIRIREKNALVSSREFEFCSTPKVVFFNNSFVIFGLFGAIDERLLFFDNKCNLLNDTMINYSPDFKVFGDKIFFIDRKLYFKTLPKFPEIEGEMITHEYLKESEIYLFSSDGTLIANLTLGGVIGFHNDTIYTIYPYGIGKFYLSNMSLEQKVVNYVLYSGWAIIQGVWGDFSDEFIAFVYWGFSGEVGRSFSGICVYPYGKTIRCSSYGQKFKRMSPIDEVKAWDRYFAVVPREESRVVIYEVR